MPWCVYRCRRMPFYVGSRHPRLHGFWIRWLFGNIWYILCVFSQFMLYLAGSFYLDSLFSYARTLVNSLMSSLSRSLCLFVDFRNLRCGYVEILTYWTQCSIGEPVASLLDWLSQVTRHFGRLLQVKRIPSNAWVSIGIVLIVACNGFLLDNYAPLCGVLIRDVITKYYQ